MDYTPNEQELEAIRLISNEITNWENGEAFITDDVSFTMRNVVKKARKNYFGIFEQQNDPTTQRRKVFVPLTETLVEDTVKNIDIDTSDIRVKAKNSSAIRVAEVFRYVLKFYLDKMGFGKILNTVIRLIAIDGTAFVKTWKDGKELKCRVIDRLNMIYDPSVNCLDDTSITERNILFLPEFKEEGKLNKWDNVDVVKGQYTADRTGFDEASNINTSEIPIVEVYERYGWFSKFVITGDENDRDDYVYGMIVASGVEGVPVIHKIKEVEKHPYVMFRFKDIWNRADGRGIGEMVLNLQAYINEIVNTRINKHRVSQMGLWKIRGGVTPQQFAKLFTTHGIKLKGQRDDVEMFNTANADQSTYQDEAVGKRWAEELSGVTDDKAITASTPATNAMIQERGTASRNNLVQENIGFAISELIEEHFIPIIKKILRKGDVVRITGNPADLEKLQQPLIEREVYTKHHNRIKDGQLTTVEEIQADVERLTEELSRQGEDRFIKITDDAFDTDFNIDVQVGEEKLNPALLAQSITQALSIAAQFPGSKLNADEALREIFDALGLDGDRIVQARETLGQAQAEADVNAQQGQAPPPVEAEAEANPIPMSAPVA